MATPRLVLDAPEALYHVMTRTAQQMYWLEDPELKYRVETLMYDMAEVYHVEILAQTCMDNHFHLVLKVRKPEPDAEDIQQRFERYQLHLASPKTWRSWHLKRYYRRFTSLSRFMWEINRRIAVMYNKIHNTKGHFWGARFKSLVIEDEEALLRVAAYVEQNGVKAGLADRPSQFPFCSAGRTQAELDQIDERKPCAESDQHPRQAPHVFVPRNRHKVPAVGMFKQLKGVARQRAYVQYMDHLSDLAWHPERVPSNFPPELARLQLQAATWHNQSQQLCKKPPTAWGERGYGSDDFKRGLQAKSKQQVLDLAHQRYQTQCGKLPKAKPAEYMDWNGAPSTRWTRKQQTKRSRPPSK